MKSDRKILLIAVTFLLFQIVWLGAELHFFQIAWFSDFNKTDRQQTVGTITSTQNSTLQRSDSEIIWRDGIENENVYAHDALLTLKNSAMKIKLKNGSELSLSENTLVYLEPVDENSKDQKIRIRFAHGSLRSKLSDIKNQLSAQSWEMNTEQGTEIQIRALESGKIELDVTKGQATATRQNQSVLVNGGESIELSKDSASEKKKLSQEIKWLELKEKIRIYSHHFPAKIPFHWQGPAAVLELQRDGIIKKQYALNSTQSQISVDLEEGTYEARLNNDNNCTAWLNVEVWPAPVIHLMSPLPRDRYAEQESFDYLWLKPQGIKSSFWQLSENPKFDDLNHSLQTKENQLNSQQSDAAAGVGSYHWRVLGYDSEGFEIPAPYSNPIYVVPNPLSAPQLNSPEIRSPAKENSKPGALVPIDKIHPWQILFKILVPVANAQVTPDFDSEKNSIKFSWGQVPGADHYVLEISEKPDFRELLVDKKTKGTSFEWKHIKVQSQTFYWRVASDSVNRMGKFSEVAEVRLNELSSGKSFPGIDVVRESPQVTSEPPVPVEVPLNPEPKPTVLPLAVVEEKKPRTLENFAALDISYESALWLDSGGSSYTLSGPTAKIFLNTEFNYHDKWVLGLIVDLQSTSWKNTNTNSITYGNKISELRSRALGTLGSLTSPWTFSMGVDTTGMASRNGLESGTLTPISLASIGTWYHFDSNEHWKHLWGFNLSSGSNLSEANLIFSSRKKIQALNKIDLMAGPEAEISQFFGTQSSGLRYLLGFSVGLSW